MSDGLDSELIALINRLNKVQAEVGGPKKAQLAHAIGEDGKIDRFVDLKNQMTDSLNEIRETLMGVQRMERQSGANPKERIQADSKIRTTLASLNENWNELDAIYKAEAKKKRSKFSKEDMALRQQVLGVLRQEIQSIRDLQRSGYVKDYKASRHVDMANSEMFRGGRGGAAGGGVDYVAGRRNNDMTHEDRQALTLLKDRDAQIDAEIVNIGKGVDELRDIALAANEEIKMQSKMLDVLETKIDDVHEHVTTINVKLKTTLDEARKSDKICVDIFCILLCIGMIIVLVKLTSDKQSQGK